MVSLFIVFLCSALISLAQQIDFNYDVRPILSDKCFACHGPDENTRQAQLRLDRRKDAILRSAIKPYDAINSKLVTRIRAEHEMLRMPPIWSDKSLTAEQQKILIDWINQGAQYEHHWSYIPAVRPHAPPESNAID